MTSRWEVEEAVNSSSIDPPGRHIVLTLLTRTTASTAEIPPRHAPSFTDLERLTGYSRSTLIEWMKALTSAGWVRRVTFDGESREGFALSVGDPNAARPARKRGSADRSGATQLDLGIETDVDPSYRQAVRDQGSTIPPGDTSYTARRYGAIPPGGTERNAPIRKNSPTESSLTTSTLTPPPPTAGADNAEATSKTAAPKPRAREPKKSEPHREDVDRVCKYLVEWIVKNGSKRPTVTQEWRDEARRMIDLDKRPLDEIRDVTAWSQRSVFWRKNIMSMPTLRKQFDRLRLAMLDERDKGDLINGPYRGRPLPESNAPKRIPRDERCPTHPGYRAETCGACRADWLAAEAEARS